MVAGVQQKTLKIWNDISEFKNCKSEHPRHHQQSVATLSLTPSRILLLSLTWLQPDWESAFCAHFKNCFSLHLYLGLKPPLSPSSPFLSWHPDLSAVSRKTAVQFWHFDVTYNKINAYYFPALPLSNRLHLAKATNVYFCCYSEVEPDQSIDRLTLSASVDQCWPICYMSWHEKVVGFFLFVLCYDAEKDARVICNG